jgi:hypothetical protein
MEIIESWEDHKYNCYAIVRYSEKERKEFKNKEYEAMWLDDGELNSFGGSVGYRMAEFDNVEEAQDFLLEGIAKTDADPDIWWEMLAV